MVPFTPLGASAVIDYTDDSTDTSITITTGGTGVPNVLYCVNEDAANIVAVNYSFVSTDTNASVPSDGANGIGAVIPPYGYAMLYIDSTYRTQGPLYISAAGHSGAGNVYVTPGVLAR